MSAEVAYGGWKLRGQLSDVLHVLLREVELYCAPPVPLSLDSLMAM